MSEEGSDIGAESEGGVVLVVERRDGLRSNAKHVAVIVGVTKDAEGGLVDGDHGAKGLDEAAALDFDKVSHYLLLGDRFQCDAKGPPRLDRLLEDGMEPHILRVLHDGLAPGLFVLCFSSINPKYCSFSLLSNQKRECRRSRLIWFFLFTIMTVFNKNRHKCYST